MSAEIWKQTAFGVFCFKNKNTIAALQQERGKQMKKNRPLSFLLALAMFLQIFLIFPGYVFASESSSEEESDNVIYTLIFMVDGKVAQKRYAPAGEALGPLPQIWASDGAVLSSWQCEDCPVSPETIATFDMVLVAQELL